MSDFKKEILKNVTDIKNTITNKDEAEKVMISINNIIDVFSNQLLEVTKRQNKLEEKTEEVFELLSNIEEELVQNMMEDFSAECPYCGEDIAYAIPEDGSDFECPKCHNTIELEMMFDGCDCDCDDCHGGCHDDCDCEDEDDEE